jgi:hypothetical protein
MNDYQKTYAEALATYQVTEEKRQEELTGNAEYLQVKETSYSRDNIGTDAEYNATVRMFEIEGEVNKKFDWENIKDIMRNAKLMLLLAFAEVMLKNPRSTDTMREQLTPEKIKKLILLRKDQKMIDIAMKARGW